MIAQKHNLGQDPPTFGSVKIRLQHMYIIYVVLSLVIMDTFKWMSAYACGMIHDRNRNN